MESVAIPLPTPARRRRAPLSSRAVNERLQSALATQGGYVVLTGASAGAAAMLLDSALSHTPTYKTIRVNAGDDEPRRAIHTILDKEVDLRPDAPQTEVRAAFSTVLANARSEGKPIVVVVDGAGDATIEQLDRLRNELGVVPESIEGVQVVLVGSRKLTKLLEGPRAAALSSRVVARIDAPIWTLPAGAASGAAAQAHGWLRMSIAVGVGISASSFITATTQSPAVAGILGALLAAAARLLGVA